MVSPAVLLNQITLVILTIAANVDKLGALIASDVAAVVVAGVAIVAVVAVVTVVAAAALSLSIALFLVLKATGCLLQAPLLVVFSFSC